MTIHHHSTHHHSTRNQMRIQAAFLCALISCLSISFLTHAEDTPAPSSEPAKAVKKTPPFPRESTDMETQMREQDIYIQWMHDNSENVSTILLKFKPGIESRPRKLISRAKAHEIGKEVDLIFEPKDLLGLADWQVLKMSKHFTEKAADALCIQIKKHPDVLECTPNGAIYAFSIPTDPLYSQQWSFNAGPGSANIEKAWGTTTGVVTTVVAVLDTGSTTHEDLSISRNLPGYDFITDPVIANDGGGRDADPSDPGDWVTQAESNGTGSLAGCRVTNSDWHGTHISGIIGATANNPAGVAGINWAAKLLPVRVLGKCGNRTNGPQDIADAIIWAAGINTGTVPANLNPAQVINMSLGGTGVCPLPVQDAINQATAKGTVVIAAAGNNGVSQSYWPANCSNVLTVVATNQIGKKESYSNWGVSNGVSAPGAAILSTVNPGTTSPVAGSSYLAYSGTSQAAAHVSGIASLMLAVKPTLTPFEVREMIKASAKPFATGSQIIFGSCSGGTGSCGSGIVNAAAAVKLAKMGKAVIAYDPNNLLLAKTHTYLMSATNGQAVGWGEANFGQLGNASLAPVTQPTIVPGLTQVDRVFAAGTTSWSILSTGEAYALGQNTFCMQVYNGCPADSFSLFGNNSVIDSSSVPVRSPLLDNVRQITVGYSGTANWYSIPTVFAVLSTGQVLAWGYSDSIGLLGLGAFPQIPFIVKTPTPILGLPAIKRIVTSGDTTLALDQSGNVWG